MSRNLRQSGTPSKVPKRRDSDTTTTSFDFSDDDGYSGVENISDSSDDDEEDVNAVEEQNIVTEDKPSASPRPQNNDNDEDDYDETVPIDADADESASWAGIVSEVDESDVFQEPHFDAGERHVHFDVPPSDSDSTDTDEDHGDFYPDIFVSQTSLDPAFRREIEDESESEGSGSFWDYGGQYDRGDSDAEEIVRRFSDDDTPTATPQAKTPTFEEAHELDGYESERFRSLRLNLLTI